MGAYLRRVRLLTTRTLAYGGALLCGLAFVERVLVPAAAWAVFAPVLMDGRVAALGAVAVAVTVRSFAQRVLVSHAEADLTHRAIRGLLDGDVLHARAVSDEDARAELAQAIYYASQQVGQELPVLVANAAASIALLTMVVAVEPRATVQPILVLIVAAGATLLWSRSRMQRAASDAWALHARALEDLVDALEGRLEIVALGLSAPFLAASRARTRAWAAANVRVAGEALLSGRLPLLALGGVAAVLAIGKFRSTGVYSMKVADVALLAGVAPAVFGVAQGLHQAARADRWVRLVAQLLEANPRAARGGAVAPPTHATVSGAPPPQRQSPVAFRDVSFRYDGAEQNALDDVTFSSEGHRVLALVGPNGSGKSTCLRLLLALAQPRSGAIRIGGVDLAGMAVEEWRRHVSFLPQRPYLPLRSTVRSAIHLLAPDASGERMVEAIRRVGLLSALKREQRDPLEARIESLSVGQRQRVALARFLCRDAALLVLDEPDANLDREGIKLVADMLRQLSRHHTIVFAAHTEELVAVADQVIALDRGRLAMRRPGVSSDGS